MPLYTPSFGDYREIARGIVDTAHIASCETVVYGSFVRGEHRPGLSDIDALIYVSSGTFIFPQNIQRIFSQIRFKAMNLCIPVQFSWVTDKTLNGEGFFTKQEGYLYEVRKGLSSDYKTNGIESTLSGDGSQGSDQDIAMIQFFHRKIQKIGELLPEIELILEKNEAAINREDQRNLQKLWDSIKKGIHMCALLQRITTSNTVQFDISALSQIKDHELATYKQILGGIGNIDGWYDFLKYENGLKSIRKLIENDFEVVCRYIDQKLGQKI